MLALSAADLQRRRVTLQTELDEQLPLVNGDRVQLQQVILNLLLNAADAMKSVDDWPKRIIIRSAQPRLREHVVMVAKAVLLCESGFTVEAQRSGLNAASVAA